MLIFSLYSSLIQYTPTAASPPSSSPRSSPFPLSQIFDPLFFFRKRAAGPMILGFMPNPQFLNIHNKSNNRVRPGLQYFRFALDSEKLRESTSYFSWYTTKPPKSSSTPSSIFNEDSCIYFFPFCWKIIIHRNI